VVIYGLKVKIFRYTRSVSLLSTPYWKIIPPDGKIKAMPEN